MKAPNTAAIDKVIAELANRDFKAAWSKYPEAYKNYHKGITTRKPRNYIPFSYTLGADTAEAVQIKRDYIAGEVTEEALKAYCLRHILKTLKKAKEA